MLFRYGKQLLFAILVMASILMISLYARESQTGSLHAFQQQMRQVLSPFQYASSSIVLAEKNIAAKADDMLAKPETLNALQEQNESLRQSIAQLEEYRAEAQRLEELLKLKDRYALEGVAARIVGRGPELYSDDLLLDKGSDDGVALGQAVMGPTGVVGQIIGVNAHSSLLRQLTSRQSGVAVSIQSSKVEGVVRGSLQGLMYLQDFPLDAQIKVGDVLVTSGLGGAYPQGLMVGTVVSVEARQGSAAPKILVSSNDTPSPLQEVFIVSKMGSSSADKQDKNKKGEDV